MTDTLERFFNWQTDMDWFWGLFLSLRPAKTERLTRKIWLTMIGWSLLCVAPLEAACAAVWAYYDYTAAKYHEARITPVVAVEHWGSKTAPGTVLFYGFCAIALCLCSCIGTHWAWNRRADRLNREESVLEPAVVAVPGVWPPPPSNRV